MLINHPRTQMFMFMPHHINRVWGQQLSGGTWENYYNAIISVCARYGVPMIDISKDGRMCTNFAAIKAYTANSDGVHPTKEGYEIFYLPVFERALNLR
jgi:lysophospholipase L1-like esterase